MTTNHIAMSTPLLDTGLASFGTVSVNTLDASLLTNSGLGVYVTDQTLGLNTISRGLVSGSFSIDEQMWPGDQIDRDMYYGQEREPWQVKRRRALQPDVQEETERWAKMIQSVQNAQTLPNKWRVAHQPDSIILATDVPGVRPADLEVTIEALTITVNSKRFDTKKTDVITYPLSEAYDPNTVEAILDCGVMTLVIKKYPARNAQKVQVKFQ